MTVWLAALVAVTVVMRDCERKSSSEAALSEVALAYWIRTRSRPPAGTTRWLRVVPALPVKLKGVMGWWCQAWRVQGLTMRLRPSVLAALNP
jgi:hypothetical protein